MVGTPAQSHKAVNSRSKLPLRNPVVHSQVFDFQDVFEGCRELVEEFNKPLRFDLTDIAGCIKALTGKNFYGCVKLAVHGTTYHSMERMLNSKSFHQNCDGKWNNAKQWRGYSLGWNAPRAKKVAEVEKLTGTKFRHEVNQVLWIALDVTVPLGNQLHKLSRRLPLKIAQLTRQCSAYMTCIKRGVAIRDGALFTSCWKLMREAGLPALAALTLLLRKAHQNHQQDVASTLALFVFRMLLVLGEELQQRGIAHLLYEFYLEHIFPLCSERVLYESAHGMAHASNLLNILAFTTCRKSKTTLTFDQRVMRMSGILVGTYGYGLYQTFSPAFGPNSTMADPKAFARYTHQIYVTEHAWLMILMCIVGSAIPLVLNPDWIDLDLDFSIFFENQLTQKTPLKIDPA